MSDAKIAEFIKKLLQFKDKSESKYTQWNLKVTTAEKRNMENILYTTVVIHTLHNQ